MRDLDVVAVEWGVHHERAPTTDCEPQVTSVGSGYMWDVAIALSSRQQLGGVLP